MEEEKFYVRELKPDGSEDQFAAEILSKEFDLNPTYALLFDDLDHESRRKALTWFFRVRLSINREYGSKCFGLFTTNEDTCVGTVCIGSIAAYTPSLWVQLRNGLLSWPFLWGISSLMRAIKSGEDFKAVSDKLIGLSDFEVMMMAITFDLQGKGYGGKLLSTALQTVKNEFPNASISLATQNERNVRFYEKHQFKLVGEEKMNQGTKAEFISYFMKQ